MYRPRILHRLLALSLLVSFCSASLFTATATAAASRKQTALARDSANLSENTPSSSSNKISTDLLRRLRQSHADSHDTVRVIFNVAGSTRASTASAALRRLGARIHKQLDALNIIVAEVRMDAL